MFGGSNTDPHKVFGCLGFVHAAHVSFAPFKNNIQDASDIVLHDDNFSSVVKGMEQGPGFEDTDYTPWN